jgi:hypothetical protein
VAIRSRARAGGRNSCLARRKVVEGMGGIPALLASAFLPSRGRSGYLRAYAKLLVLLGFLLVAAAGRRSV